MPELPQSEVEGLQTWAKMLIERGAYDVTDIAAQIDFFGTASDAAYLVIDLYTSDSSATEYCFLAANEADEGQCTKLIFDFLNEMNYSLKNVLAWLNDATFANTEMGDCVIFKRLAVWRKYSMTNQS